MTNPKKSHTPAYKDFEDFLQDKHAWQYGGTDDCMPDDYADWLADLDNQDLIRWAEEYAKIKVDEAKDEKE